MKKHEKKYHFILYIKKKVVYLYIEINQNTNNMKRACTNPISKAMTLCREDYRSNREWWHNEMGTGQNSEYLCIHYNAGYDVIIDSSYFHYEGATCLPRFRVEDVDYISRYYGDNIETTTAADIIVDTDCIILYNHGVEYFRYEMTENEVMEMRRRIWELDEDTDSTAWMLDYCRALAISKMQQADLQK